MISRQVVEEAATRIAAHVRRTPVLELEAGAFGVPARTILKLELHQHAGSFKSRGAFNRMLSTRVGPAGVIAASGGNHGAAVAYAARQLGMPAEIFVPEITSPVKVERLRQYGARIVVAGASYAEALEASSVRARETGALVVHAYDQPEVVAGQGTLARELAEQVGPLDRVFIAVGGGGLIGGVGAWFQGEVRLVGVEPVRCPTLHRALAAGRPIDVEVSGIAADSLGARRIGTLGLAIARRHVERVVTVEDEAILAAQHLLWDALRIAAEPGGAAALAGLLAVRDEIRAGERIGVVVCGGNADPSGLASPAPAAIEAGR